MEMTEEAADDPPQEDSLLIHTPKGRVQGMTLTAATGKMVDAWLGIPYAQKPLGKPSTCHSLG